MDPVDNITRRKNTRRGAFSLITHKSLSEESVDSLDSNLSTRSMMDLSTNYKSDEVLQLESDIDALRQQLLSAHAEIETLHLENSSLKNIVEEVKQRNNQLKSMYITSMSIKRGECTGSTRASRISSKTNKANMSARRLNLDSEFCTPKSRIDRSSFVPPSSPNKSENSKPVSSLIAATAEKPHHAHISNKRHTSKKLGNEEKLTRENMPNRDPSHSQHKPNFASRCRMRASKKGQLILLTDNQGEGIMESIYRNKKKLIIKDYDIIGFKKPDAATYDVLSYCNVLAKTVTKDDNIVIMTGCNDPNLSTFLSELRIALNLLRNCNVFVVNILHNEYIKEKKLNDQVRLLTSAFDNCVFIKTTQIIANITQQIIQHVNTVQYRNTFLSYKSNIFLTEPAMLDSVSSFKNSDCMFPTLNSTKKGTIPYYFRKIQESKISNSFCNQRPTKRFITDYFIPVKTKSSSAQELIDKNDRPCEFFRC